MSVAAQKFAPKGLFSMPRFLEHSQLHRFLGSIRARLLGIVALFGVALVAMVATLTGSTRATSTPAARTS